MHINRISGLVHMQDSICVCKCMCNNAYMHVFILKD